MSISAAFGELSCQTRQKPLITKGKTFIASTHTQTLRRACHAMKHLQKVHLNLTFFCSTSRLDVDDGHPSLRIADQDTDLSRKGQATRNVCIWGRKVRADLRLRHLIAGLGEACRLRFEQVLEAERHSDAVESQSLQSSPRTLMEFYTFPLAASPSREANLCTLCYLKAFKLPFLR